MYTDSLWWITVLAMIKDVFYLVFIIYRQRQCFALGSDDEDIVTLQLFL